MQLVQQNLVLKLPLVAQQLRVLQADQVFHLHHVVDSAELFHLVVN
jgi:hypothetical protein